MQSTAPLFSKALFKNNLHRFWPILAAYSFFVFILSFGLMMNFKYYEKVTPEIFVNNIFGLSQLFSFVIALFAIATAVAVYSYIHNSTATAMVNTLPYTRKTVFISHYISGLFMLLIPLIVLFLFIMGIGINYACLDMAALTKWLFVFTSLSVLLYSLAVSLGMLTGHVIAHIAFFGIANFLLITLEILIKAFLGFFLYGFTDTGYRTTGLMAKATPIIYTGSAAYKGAPQGDWAVWIAYFIVGIILAFLALQLYEKRKMENTGDVMAIRALNPLFKYGVTFCSSFAFGLILIEIFNIRENFLWSVILLLLAGMIGYFIAEMLLKKSYRVFNTYKGFVIYALILIIVSLSIYSDWYGYASRLPDINKVEAVAFANDGLSYNTENHLLAEKNLIYIDDIPNLPNSLALTYGTPIEKIENPAGGYRYVYGNIENLTKEETKLLWSLIPGIYMEEKSITDIYELHTYLSENVKAVRNNYRGRNNSTWYAGEEHLHSYYYINFIYKFDNDKTKTYKFPVLMPQQLTDELDKEIFDRLISIAGSQERRAQKIAAAELKTENIYKMTFFDNINYYPEKFPFQKLSVPTTVNKNGEIQIAPEDYAGFLNALKTDYLHMSDEEMLKLNYNNWSYVRFAIDNQDLSSDNKYRTREYSLDIDYNHKNVLRFLHDKDYIDDDIYNFVQEYSQLVKSEEPTASKISLAAK